MDEMKTIPLTGKETEDLFMNDGNEFLILVEDGEWEQDGKYQFATFIYKHILTGRFYRLHLHRSGSYHTDWYYSYEYDIAHDLEEVKKVEVVKHEWKKV